MDTGPAEKKGTLSAAVERVRAKTNELLELMQGVLVRETTIRETPAVDRPEHRNVVCGLTQTLADTALVLEDCAKFFSAELAQEL